MAVRLCLSGSERFAQNVLRHLPICLAKLRLLRIFGHELRRPAADYLRDGIYELRAKHGTVQYRMLYFFHGRNVAVIAHCLTKEKAVPPDDIDRTITRRSRYEKDPARHRCPQTVEDLGAAD
jgi:phage-related protein